MGGVVAEICAESEGGAVEKIRKDVTVGIESDHRIDGDYRVIIQVDSNLPLTSKQKFLIKGP